jgi:hypothetical protein
MWSIFALSWGPELRHVGQAYGETGNEAHTQRNPGPDHLGISGPFQMESPAHSYRNTLINAEKYTKVRLLGYPFIHFYKYRNCVIVAL